MQWRNVIVTLVLFTIISSTAEAKKKRKFDGDFEFADEEESKNLRKEGKKTWILDPGSDLCQALKCKKKELCLLEDEFTAVCVSKKELHKNGDVIVPKSKVKEMGSRDDEMSKESYDEDEEDDSDYYDDEDEDFKSDKSGSSPSTTFQSKGNNISPPESSSCTPCPVVKPTFLCGSDNRTYSSLCRLDYHNCVQNSKIAITCKGFCPCKVVAANTGVSSSGKNNGGANEKNWGASGRWKKVRGTKSKVEQQGMKKYSKKDSMIDNGLLATPPVTPTPYTSNNNKDRYVKYKDFYGFKSSKMGNTDKTRSYNDVLGNKPVANMDCNEEELESMGNRLLDWFTVVMTDTQKRKLGRRNRNSQVHFGVDCGRQVQWMFQHLNTEDDGQLSLQELYDLENDRNEKCIKPFLDRCDSDKDIFISPREWCNCFVKTDRSSSSCRGKNCAVNGASYDNEVDDEDDADVEGSGSLDM